LDFGENKVGAVKDIAAENCWISSSELASDLKHRDAAFLQRQGLHPQFVADQPRPANFALLGTLSHAVAALLLHEVVLDLCHADKVR